MQAWSGDHRRLQPAAGEFDSAPPVPIVAMAERLMREAATLVTPVQLRLATPGSMAGIVQWQDGRLWPPQCRFNSGYSPQPDQHDGRAAVL